MFVYLFLLFSSKNLIGLKKLFNYRKILCKKSIFNSNQYFSSFILVPYYPWKLSHRHHHKNTGNIDKDEIFYPVRKGRDDSTHDTHKGFVPFFGFGFGWFYYLVKGYSPRKSSHINPWDPMFVKNVLACVVSILGCMVTLFGLLALYGHLGLTFSQFQCHYIMPVFGFGTWLVVTTFLHHQV